MPEDVSLRVRGLFLEQFGGEVIGGGEIRFRCPAPHHDDSHPSACWNESKGCWHCLGCGAKGSTSQLYAVLAGSERGSLARTVHRPRPLPSERGRGSSSIAHDIWKRETLTAGSSLVEAYLASRGITSPIPVSLRFHRSLLHKESARSWPAMVAGIELPEGGRLAAIHRTWLRPDGKGKADVEPQRKVLGSIRGGAVRLAPIGDTLLVGEGIETTLSGMQLFDLPGWAALSTGHMRKLVLPPEVRSVQILADSDDGGAGIAAAQAAAALWRREGRQVEVWPAPAGKDWNDVLREAR